MEFRKCSHEYVICEVPEGWFRDDDSGPQHNAVRKCLKDRGFGTQQLKLDRFSIVQSEEATN